MSVISRLYDSAKSLLQNQPKCEVNINACVKNSNHNMAVTRMKKTNDSKEVDKKVENTPISPQSTDCVKKRSRSKQQEENETLVSPHQKKQKILPLREKTEDCVELHKSHSSVDILEEKTKPVSQKSILSNENTVNNRNHKKIGDSLLEKKQINIKTTPKNRAEDLKIGSEVPRIKKLPTNSENNAFNVETVNPDGSEDDAPEVVTNLESEKVVKTKFKNTTRALHAQKLATRKKSLEQAKKRKMLKSQQNDLDKKSKTVYESGENQFNSQVEVDTEHQHSSENTCSALKISKSILPDKLPLEYLEDDDSLKFKVPTTKPLVAKSRKIKFETLIEKDPKDRRVENTTYRIIKTSNKNLAPRAAFNAKKIKETWLQGRCGKMQESSRQSFSRNFKRL